MSDALGFLALPFAAAVAFVSIHAYFGVHVLRRRIVFADLALAQLSALGATVAFAGGHAPGSLAGFGYALLFTVAGALLLTLARPLSRSVSQEAFVGILYVVATAATVLVVDRSPQGAEHVKSILVGNILTVEGATVAKFAALYAAIGLVHWFIRRPLLAASSDPGSGERRPAHLWLWDFAFYVSFGVVVTSSVQVAGVLLVFSFLIVPALLGSFFSQRMAAILAIAWASGIAASAAGLVASYVLDLPTGAAMVAVLALALVLAGACRLIFFGERRARAARRRVTAVAVASVSLSVVVASAAWLMIHPHGDQPLLALVERAANLGPPEFLNATDARIFEEARRDTVRFQAEVARLDAMERDARYRGPGLSDEEVRHIASYQQSFNEMVRGERFVQDVLLGKSRERERWWIGLPALLLAIAGLVAIARRPRPEIRSGSRAEPAAPPVTADRNVARGVECWDSAPH